MNTRVRHFRRRRLSPEEGELYSERILAMPVAERPEKAAELHLDDPEMLLALLAKLGRSGESSPALVLDEATFLYQYLEELSVRFPIDPILYDEREYFLGESARLAGAACRMLSRRDDARFWFELSEMWFLATENSAANIARVAYQKLALRTDEHGDLPLVLKLIPHLIANFERMRMAADALKARFLEAATLKEMGRFAEAAQCFKSVIAAAEALPNENLLAAGYVNIAQIHCFLGEAGEAREVAKVATPLLLRLGHHVALAKLQWGVGYLLRKNGCLVESIDAFRQAQREFREIQMNADVAAVHLVVADLLLDAGQPSQAEWEIRAALPIIEEYKLVPEGIAAFSLLRDSLRRRQIDRQALRNLHGYFRHDQD